MRDRFMLKSRITMNEFSILKKLTKQAKGFYYIFYLKAQKVN